MRCQFRKADQSHCHATAKLAVSFEFYNETYCYAVCSRHAGVLMGMKINPKLVPLSAYAQHISR